MEKFIEFKNLNFAYDSKHAFHDFSLDIAENDIITIIGTGASGKTTLLKILCNKLPSQGLYFKGMPIDSYNPHDLQGEIVVIFDSPTTETFARDELKKYIHTLNLKEEEINERITNLNKFFPISAFYDKKIEYLTKGQIELLKILRYLIIKPHFLAIDMCLGNLSDLEKRLFFEYIKKEKITLLNVTADLNDCLFGNKTYILDNFSILFGGTTFSVMKGDTLLKRLGFKLPLPINISIGLNNYDVMKKIYKDSEKLVNALWK